MQLSPKSAIPVSYTASIPGDTTLYYVQAVLRDTASSTVLQTLNLTQESSTPNRYTGSFEPVSDPSGLGRPVDITITVYNDSAYTDPSLNYQISQLSYVVLQPFIANLGNGGGGSNVSYEKIAATMLAVLEGAPKKEDADRVLGAISGIPRTEFDYERLERVIEGFAERSSSDTASSGESLKADMRQFVADLAGKHAETTTALHGRFDKVDSALSGADSRDTEGRYFLREAFTQALSEIHDTLKGIPDDHKKILEEKLASFGDDVKEYLRANLGEKEIRMVYNVTPDKKEKEVKTPVEPAFDPLKIAAELL